jgi:D-sedoheptulose 7-phosphate isomerase
MQALFFIFQFIFCKQKRFLFRKFFVALHTLSYTIPLFCDSLILSPVISWRDMAGYNGIMNSGMQVKQYFQAVSYALAAVEEREVQRVAELLRGLSGRNGAVWLVGNGGSAATAMHFANDLWKACHIKAWALPGMVPIVSAYGNDQGWENMYGDAMRSMFEPEDILIAISCSGVSPNVLCAAGVAQPDQLVVMTGMTHHDNKLARFPSYAKLLVPSNEIKVVEDVHLAICHSIVGILQEA